MKKIFFFWHNQALADVISFVDKSYTPSHSLQYEVFFHLSTYRSHCFFSNFQKTHGCAVSLKVKINVTKVVDG